MRTRTTACGPACLPPPHLFPACPCSCKSPKCACRGFHYIVAEGAWILKCRCKHKHVDHDAATHACARPSCACAQFDSPWVCNCDHPWAEHTQIEVLKQRQQQEQQQGLMEAVQDLNRWDLLRRGGGAAGPAD